MPTLDQLELLLYIDNLCCLGCGPFGSTPDVSQRWEEAGWRTFVAALESKKEIPFQGIR